MPTSRSALAMLTVLGVLSSACSSHTAGGDPAADVPKPSAGKPVASVCHAPTALINAKDKSGRYLVENKNITAFSNSEEDGVGLSQVVPFLLEDALKQRGAVYHKGEDWASFVQVDGQLITGQNPASSAETAKALLQLLA